MLKEWRSCCFYWDLKKSARKGATEHGGLMKGHAEIMITEMRNGNEQD